MMRDIRRAAGSWRERLRRRSTFVAMDAWPGLVGDMLADLARPGLTAAHHRVLRRILAIPADSEAWSRLGESADQLVQCLAAEWVGPTDGRLPAIQDANFLVFSDYTTVLRRLGPVALPPARRLLAGPCAPVNSYGHDGGPQTSFGPKLSALALLQACGDGDDRCLLEALVRNQHEDARVRVEAAVVWSCRQPLAAAAAAVEECLTTLGPGSFERDVAPRLALLGAPLVPALLACLRPADPEWQGRARVVLGLMGDVAVPGLVEACYGEPVTETAEFALSVLARLDRRAFAVVSGSRANPTRGLSAAEYSADPRLGLGRSAAPAGQGGTDRAAPP